MKIAFITFEYPPFIMGGAGIYAQNVTRELAKLGHQVVVFTPVYNDLGRNKYADDNVRVVEIPVNGFPKSKSLQMWLHLPKVIKETETGSKFDIVHFNSLSYWFLKKKIANAPHIITIHHSVVDAITNNNLTIVSRLANIRTENNPIFPLVEKLNINRADKIVAVSNFTKERILRIYKIQESKIDVIYNGVDQRHYYFQEDELALLKNHFKLNDNPIILFVGRVDDPRKGLDLLLNAFKIVLRNIKANLLIIGRGNQTKAKILARKMNISDNTFFTGYADDITLKKCYALGDLFVCPSSLEGFGLALIEAMSAGKSIVAIKSGAIPELIKSEINGLLVENNPEELAKAITLILSNKSFRETIGANNIQKALSYRWDTTATKLEKAYSCLLRAN